MSPPGRPKGEFRSAQHEGMAAGAVAGIGLRQPHYADVMARRPALPFVEVHAENFFGDGGAALQVLQAVREHWPVSLHGVGLSLGSAAGLDPWHLDRLARLAERTEPLRVSDHACFARAPGLHANDLLPIGCTRAALDILAANVGRVQDRLRRPIGVENLSAYLSWDDAGMPEPGFFTALARRTGCWLLLDVNNLVVNALNAGQEPVAAACAWIDALGDVPVGEIHVAGYDDRGGLVIDDHGSRVRAPVWAVYAHALRRFGPVPTLVEWDTGLPALEVLLQEAAAADRIAALSPRGRPGGGVRTAQLEATPVGAAGRQAGEPRDAGHEDAASRGEAERQQGLLASLRRRGPTAADSAGLRAYRANAGAAAERALAAAFPTVRQLMGEDSFAALARALWHHAPPDRGDLALWGDALPAFLAADPALADEPCLADVARVDLAVHRAEAAADAALDPATLHHLAGHPPETLRLRLAPGAALVLSPHPVAMIWAAHRSTAEDRFAPVRAAFAAGQGESAFVWRRGWRGDVAALDAAQAAFVQALIGGADLDAALDAAPGLDFEAWLVRALGEGWLAGVERLPPRTP